MGLPLTKEEAVIDQEVVWLHKGKAPYKATIVGSHTGKSSFKRAEGAKSGSMKAAKSVDSPGSDHETSDDDDNVRNSIPSDVSDEEQGDFNIHVDKNLLCINYYA